MALVDHEGARSETLIAAALSLQPGFSAVSAEAESALLADGSGGAAAAAVGALASLYAQLGSSYRADLSRGKHPALLALLVR